MTKAFDQVNQHYLWLILQNFCFTPSVIQVTATSIAIRFNNIKTPYLNQPMALGKEIIYHFSSLLFVLKSLVLLFIMPKIEVGGFPILLNDIEALLLIQLLLMTLSYSLMQRLRVFKEFKKSLILSSNCLVSKSTSANLKFSSVTFTLILSANLFALNWE